MKTIFKNLKIRVFSVSIVLMSVLLSGVFMQSCSNEDEIDTATNINSDFETMGQEHNKGLDYIYEQLKKNQGSNDVTLRSASSIFDIVKDASVQFISESDYGINIEKEKIYEIVNSTSEINSLRSATANNNLNTDVLVLTDKQQHYLNKYNKIIESLKNNNIDPVIKKLNKFDIEVASNCTPEEAVPLFAASSVGRHSLQYWNDNLYKWAALLNPDAKQAELALVPRLKSGTIEVNATEDDWQWFCNTLISMGQSDGIGAAIGAGMGLPVGGVGAIPGGVAGGCYASAGAGIKSLFQKWGIF
ncbi:hypothetical protein AGMMS49982_15480 [Bacteroidia bacterium]|nr:hypothetical protein AGMMS49982_15480 [Bacteroidia bacterium]